MTNYAPRDEGVTTPPALNEEAERAYASLRTHEIVSVSGGTAAGSRWSCRCGEMGVTVGGRDHATHLGRQHVAKSIAGCFQCGDGIEDHDDPNQGGASCICGACEGWL